MQPKAQWLFNRKEQILNEMAECEKQTKDIVQALSAEVDSGRKEVAALRESIRVAEQSHRQEISKCLIQIKTLQGLIVSKDDALQQLKTSHSNLLSSSEQKNTTNQQYFTRLLELEHLLTVQKNETERVSRQHYKQLQKKQEFHMQEILRLKKDYEQQLNNFQMNTKKTHQQELAQLKRNNLQILQKLQEEHQANFAKNSQTSKKTELDCGRLITQNNRLLSVVNENKLRIMTLESSLASQAQQNKLLQKQFQIFKENSQREIAYLKQEKIQLGEKCRKMADKVEQLTWTNRQNQINKANEMQRIRKEVDQSFKQVLAKAEEERNSLQSVNTQLKNSLKIKIQELQRLQQASLKNKEIGQIQEKQLLQLKNQKQLLEKQAKSIQQSAPIKLNDQLKKELIRKDCEIQVLHQEIKRLKSKVNTASAAQQQFMRVKETLLQQNKMLLAEVNFLKKEKYKRDRNESRMSRSNFLSDMQSERSRDDGELQQYKKVIQMMTTQMNQVVGIIKEKQAKIQKLQALVKRLERQLRDGR